MAIYLSRKKGGTVATPITPSNASPAQMTANTPVNPTANGYAIESYRNISPYNTPQLVFEGEILKVNSRDGKVIDNISSYVPSNTSPSFLNRGVCYRTTTNKDGYAIESYDDIIPSSTPTSVASGDIVKIGGSGVIVDSVPPTPTSITPSNSSPVALTANTPVNPTASGYAISSYSSKTPSDSSHASVSSGAIIKASASGYLYKSSGLGKCKTGSVSLTANTNNTITTGFQPKYICWNVGTGSLCAYNEDISTTQFRKANSSGISNVNVGTSASYNLISISSTGFVIRGASSAVTMNYFAIG